MSTNISIYTGNNSAGIRIEHCVAKGLIEISGWYDQFAGIEQEVMTVSDCLKALGLTNKGVEQE